MNPPEPTIPGAAVSRRSALLGALAAGVATLGLLLGTSPFSAVAWDEAYTLARLDRVRTWFRAIAEAPGISESLVRHRYLPQQDAVPAPDLSRVRSRSDLLSRESLEWFWPFAREEPHGHPPVYAEVALAGDVLAPGWPMLARARLGSMLVHSLAAGALFAFLCRRRGWWAATASVGAWDLQPHLFALAHYATYDALLTSFWLFAMLAFFLAVEERRPARKWPRGAWMAAFGLALGLAMGTKLTGWLIPVPMLVWSVLYRSRTGFVTVFVGGLTGVALMVSLTPPFWPGPLAGLFRFFRSNLTRAETIPIHTLFLGHVYKTPAESLPWYNTLVWTFLVTPAGFLGLAVAGAGRAVKRWKVEPFGALVVLNGSFLLILRALPHAPGHDGVRQFLPAFGVLAVSAGLGAGWLASRKWGRILTALSIVEAAVSVAVMMPVPLSYFTPLVGGLPGASALGMEPTFYWDALTDGALKTLAERTPAGGNVLFSGYPVAWHGRRTGRISVGVCPFDGPDFAWYVVQNRPGSMSEIDRALVARLGDDPRYVLRSKFGVPLVWAFPGDAPELAPAHEMARKIWASRPLSRSGGPGA